MDKFQEMRAFVTVVDTGSFVRAADALNLSKTAVSRRVAIGALIVSAMRLEWAAKVGWTYFRGSAWRQIAMRHK